MFSRFFSPKGNSTRKISISAELARLERGMIINLEQRLRDLENKNANLEKKINALEKETQDHKVKHRNNDISEKALKQYPLGIRLTKTVEGIKDLILEKKHWRQDIPIILFEVTKALGKEMDGDKKENND